MSKKYFYHVRIIDFDTGCHEAIEPILREKPLIVGEGVFSRKGKVLACNEMARRYGVREGMTLEKVLEACPRAVMIKKNRILYRETGKRIMDSLRHYTYRSYDTVGKIEQDGENSCYLDMTGRIKNGKIDPLLIAADLKEKILDISGMESSIGIAPVKVMAKIASGEVKAGEIKILKYSEIKEFVARLPLEKLPGMDNQTAIRLRRRMGIGTLGRFASSSAAYHGMKMKHLWEIVNGMVEGEVMEEEEGMKSAGKSRKYYEKMIVSERVYRHIEDQVKNARERMIDSKFRCWTVTVIITRDDHKVFKRSLTLQQGTTDRETLTALAREILLHWVMIYEFVTGEKPFVRKTVVRLSNFRGNSNEKKPLTAWFNGKKVK